VGRRGWAGGQRGAVVPWGSAAQQILACVWLYHRFPLSYREVEEMMLGGIVVSHETIRQWCAKFGQSYANGLRWRQPRPGDKWQLDEVFIKIAGKTHYLWHSGRWTSTATCSTCWSPPGGAPRPRPSIPRGQVVKRPPWLESEAEGTRRARCRSGRWPSSGAGSR
jgi:hypothetical protein